MEDREWGSSCPVVLISHGNTTSQRVGGHNFLHGGGKVGGSGGVLWGWDYAVKNIHSGVLTLMGHER